MSEKHKLSLIFKMLAKSNYIKGFVQEPQKREKFFI